MSSQISQISQISPEIRADVEDFQNTLQAFKRGAISEEEFKPFRTKHGIYGIRNQINIQLVRVKVPFGELSAEQLNCLAEVAQEYANDMAHVTTRQDFELHWVNLDDVPEVLWKLAEVGMTTRESGGNTVRNVTACHLSGVCDREVFDVTPYAKAVSAYFLRHPLVQKLPRKVKIAFSGCPEDCAYVGIQDIGAMAKIRRSDGEAKRGFRIYLGGGLGALPRSAMLLEDFTPAEELLPTCEAVLRVFDRLGERENRTRARLKFVVQRLGEETFRDTIKKEREAVKSQPNKSFPPLELSEETPPPKQMIIVKTAHKDKIKTSATYWAWQKTNLTPQRQIGYWMVHIRLPEGNVTSKQLFRLAEIAKIFSDGKLRTTIQQNMALRWVKYEALPALYEALVEADLAAPGAETILDVTACLGGSNCGVGICKSQALAQTLTQTLQKFNGMVEELKDTRIKISGCPNSCGHHHLGTIGLFGTARKVDGRPVPHYQLLLGGEAKDGQARFGKPILRLPAKMIPEALTRLIEFYCQERRAGESFLAFLRNRGEREFERLLKDLIEVPPYGIAPDLYIDWGSEEDFKLDVGRGECAV